MTPRDTDLGTLIDMVREHDWRCVLLEPRSKRPAVSLRGRHLQAEGAEQVRHWVQERDGNVGVYAGRSGRPHVVLDFDRVDAALEMMNELGELPPTVETGSGKVHVFVRWIADLPGTIEWKGVRAGEILRLDTQYTVAPPSVHPQTGNPYRWTADPRAELLPELPEAWRRYLLGEMNVPEWMLVDERDSGVPGWLKEEGEWTGPTPEELIRRALLLPGGRPRSGGVKFQCPACRAEGHDRHRDNAKVFPDGRWGCAYAPADREHRRAIGRALGVVAEDEGAGSGLCGLEGLRGL